ncbi:MAG: signal recognition particle-docking protein FtsY [Erysipelotrichaceae bacterium]|nr:signal recognition particle-docking protein FtsY [Erysipelotrichaceae bacterium]
MGLFTKKKKNINSYLDYNTGNQSLWQRFTSMFSSNRIDEDTLENILSLLIQSDVGIETSEELLGALEADVRKKKLSTIEEVFGNLEQNIIDLYNEQPSDVPVFEKGQLNFIMMVGVNGSGKTTSISKIANYYLNQGYSIGIIGADTFRAGAYNQIQNWAERLNVECIIGREKADPSSVLVDGCRHFREKKVDIIIADTAGRLQNKTNLMNELAKMKRVVTRELDGITPYIWLTVDATTGQNGLSQAKFFLEVSDVNGVVLTKMDGTSKGGIVLAIRDKFHLPVVFITYGENIEAIEPFSLDAYLKFFLRNE